MDATLGRAAGVSPESKAQRARIQRMVKVYFGLVWRYLRRLGLSEADADDGAQQVFLVAARKLDRIDDKRERSFLLGVSVRVAADCRRAQRRRRQEPESLLANAVDPRPDPEQALQQQRACSLLDGFLEQLSAELRVVFVLYEIEGLKTREIAEALDVPLGTVASRLKRSRDQFEATVQGFQNQAPPIPRPSVAQGTNKAAQALRRGANQSVRKVVNHE
jgi:RNA polymerase sigma-70 factor (ECF subfamily)